MRANSARFVLAGESFLIQTKRNEIAFREHHE